MNDLTRIFFFLGSCFFAAGCLTFLLGKFPHLGKLPGDIIIKKESFTFYLPLATSLILSIFLSIILTFFHKR